MPKGGEKVEVKRVRLVYFSPTGTTQKVLESIAQGIAVEDVRHVDLTLPGSFEQAIRLSPDELALMGAPVYGGRLPADAVRRFRQIAGGNALAVLIVTYGNREFEDALLEWKHLAMELGLKPVAGGAFIGEHSFSTKELPVADGRPDRLDLQKATDFGARIKDKVTAMSSPDAPMDLELPGRYPYESTGARSMAVSPVTREDTCILCGTCAGVCPTAAVSVDGSVATVIERCIRCCACVKSCPTGARVVEDGKWIGIANWLHDHCSARKEPQVFGIDP
jgi:NAD-dependent dihydropyrimidine dehydrogenase PreA subunit/flavodoxin